MTYLPVEPEALFKRRACRASVTYTERDLSREQEAKSKAHLVSLSGKCCGSGKASGSVGNSRSPRTCKRSRLVTSSVRRGQAANSSTSCRAAATTDSKWYSH